MNSPHSPKFPDPATVLSQLAQMAEPMLRSVPPPPAWLQQEFDQRLVLWLNHVLGAESEAVARLKRHAGKVVRVEVAPWRACWRITPAGLLDPVQAPEKTDLSLAVSDSSLPALTRAALEGKRPDVRIEGDVQLAAEIGWLMEHVRWDYEEDLAKIVGDVPAAFVGQTVRKVGEVLRSWVSGLSGSKPS